MRTAEEINAEIDKVEVIADAGDAAANVVLDMLRWVRGDEDRPPSHLWAEQRARDAKRLAAWERKTYRRLQAKFDSASASEFLSLADGLLQLLRRQLGELACPSCGGSRWLSGELDCADGSHITVGMMLRELGDRLERE